MILSWQQIPSPLVSEILCHNFDGVVIDTEHGCFNNETLYGCIQIVKASKKRCFVRLTAIDKTMIRHCLDTGADGLIFSMIETEEQCKKIKEFCFYPPVGKRGLGLVRQNLWGENDLINDKPMIIPQIESKTAVDNIKKITTYDFDYYLIGPYDLSMSLNIPGKLDNKEFICYINKINSSVPKNKLAIHIPSNVNEQFEKYKDYGMKCLGMDTVAILHYNKEILKNA
tara:strand:- start:208 stop:888 length:681 start_codon:yes stop_codon:yes gene_type:complete